MKYQGPWKWQPEKDASRHNSAIRAPFRRPWKPEIQEIQGALEMASGKGAGIAKSTSLMLLWCSPRFGGLGSRKNKKYKRKGAGIANSTAPHFGGLGSRKSRKSKGPWKLHQEKDAFVVFPHFGGLGSRKSKKYRGLGNGNRKRSGYCKNKPLIWKCYFPVPAALVPIWRPQNRNLGALPKMVDFLISR